MNTIDLNTYAIIGAKLYGQLEGGIDVRFLELLFRYRLTLAEMITKDHPEFSHAYEIMRNNTDEKTPSRDTDEILEYVNLVHDVHYAVLLAANGAFLYRNDRANSPGEGLVDRVTEAEGEIVGMPTIAMLCVALWFSDYKGYKKLVYQKIQELFYDGWYSDNKVIDLEEVRRCVESNDVNENTREDYRHFENTAAGTVPQGGGAMGNTNNKVSIQGGLAADRASTTNYQSERRSMENAYILLVDEISNMKELVSVLNQVHGSGRGLLILTGGIDERTLATLEVNQTKGLIDVACVRVPADGGALDMTLTEVSNKFGGKVFFTRYGMNASEAKLSDLGEAGYVVIGHGETVISDSEITDEKKDTDPEAAAGDDFWDSWLLNDTEDTAGPASVEDTTADTDSAVTLEEIFEETAEDEPSFDVFYDAEADTSQSWKDWKNIPAGNEQAITAMAELREHVDAFRSELKRARQNWTEEKIASQKIFESVTTDARNRCESDKNRIQGEYQNNVNSVQSRKNTAGEVVTECNSFLKDIPAVEAVKKAARDKIRFVENDLTEVEHFLEIKKGLYRQLYDVQMATADRQRNDKLDKARREQIDRDNQADRRFEIKNKEIRDHCQKEIEEGFNKATVHAYGQEIMSSRFNAVNYESPSEVPDYVMLGNIGLIIPNGDQDDNAVVQAVELQTAEVGKKESDRYIVSIPYAQRLSDGISLLMRYAPAEREYVQSLMQPLLLKLFMSFPAGKLEATMIDPLELGASFSDIPKLAEGPESARIIDTKIWSKEKDIENAIATLRQRLENMTQAYGGDQASRLKKEVVRVLAITDFPVGFNDAALKDLHAIVRNSASLGVCVLICANDEELEKMKDKNATLVEEITQSVVETKASGNRLMLVGGRKERMFLELDDMEDVLARKREILSQISGVIEHMQLKIEHFGSMFNEDIYDSNNWFMGNHDEIAIPLGIKGASTIVKMVLGRGGGSTEHHALIAGQTGAGKSTLLHTLIMSTLISYSPDEVQMYLLDFKEGVEFSIYTQYRLPSLRVVAINSEREFGLTVLKELCTELETRTKHFTRYGVSDINGYSALMDVPKVPKLLLIFDEVQELFRNKDESDSITSECLSCLNKLVMQGRAMGIHVILACQDFHNCSGLETYFSQMAIRIAVKGSEEGAASILNSDNAGIRTLQNQPAGAAIYNGGGGVESANNFFQVSYINESERRELLTQMDAYYTDPDIAPLYDDQETRILLTNAEDNIHNCFNRLILEGPRSIEPLGTSADGYGLLLGQGFGKKSVFIPEISPRKRDNLLVACRDEKIALSIFELAAMSVLYEELHTTADKANALVYIVDLFADELNDGECSFKDLKRAFPQQIEVARLSDVEDLIDSLYALVVGRSDGSLPATERVFLLFFGINRARRILPGGLYDDDGEGEISSNEKLRTIISKGPQFGINSIVWGENVRSFEQMLGDRYEGMFDKRIAYGLDEDSMERLVAETEGKALRGKTAVYMDYGCDVKNTHFRPYDIPAQVWIEEYARAYDEIVKQEGGYADYD